LAAFGLMLGLFTFWTVLGCALLTLLERRMDGLRKLLLAPALGLVINGLPLFLLNLNGIPIARCALPVGAALLIGAVISLRAARPGMAIPAGLGSATRGAVLRQYLPFALVLLLGAVLTGRPMLRFGFDWVSFCNDDMANYCLGAQRVLDHAYLDRPTPTELMRGVDYVQQMWFLHVPGKHRPGSEMILAFVCALTKRDAVELFMVVILAMHLAQISALAGLIYREPKDAPVAIGASAMLALSALASLGALYQLIAQVAGLAIALMAGALLLRPMTDDDALKPLAGFAHHLRQGTLIGIAVAGVMVFYPEVFPFLAAPWLLYTMLGVLAGRLPVKPLVATLAVGTVVTLVLMNWYAPVSLTYLLKQAGTGTRVENPQSTLFPYYLMPTGLSNLWGFQPLATLGDDPWQSAAVGAGAVLLIVVTGIALVRAFRGDPNATFALVMIGVGIYLFRCRAGFGLYKLAMYAQPVFLGVLAAGVVGLFAKRVRASVCAIGVVTLVTIGVFSAVTQHRYVRGSCGIGQTFNEILDASDSRVYDEFRTLAATQRAQAKRGHSVQFLADSYNLVLAKFQSLANRGSEMAFPSNRFYYPGGYKSYPTPRGRELIQAADDLMVLYNAQFRWDVFRVHEHDTTGATGNGVAVSGNENAAGDAVGDGDATNTFLFNNLAAEMADRVATQSGNRPKSTVEAIAKSGQAVGAETLAKADGERDVVVIATTGKQSPFNRRHIKSNDPKANFVVLTPAQARNHLVFVSSELGHPYFSGGKIKPNYAIYQLEAEPLFFRGDTMAGVGRHVLFQVINPSIDRATGKGRVRLVLEMTGSYKADNDNKLPPAELIGSTHVRFPGLVGRGSTRAVSEPVEPQYLGGQPYVQIDMGMEGTRFPEPRRGLMRLFGTDVATDRRSLVGFLRDMSLVSEEQYAAFKPPSEIAVFAYNRNDLRDYPELEYSGIYEDGWVSEHSFCRLSPRPGSAGTAQAVVKGEVPALPGGDPNFETLAELCVDGKTVARELLRPGVFELRGNVPTVAPTSANATHAVELKFSHFQHLPENNGYPDGRPVAARVRYIGLQSAAATTVARGADR
jgi:hypothetical protein